MACVGRQPDILTRSRAPVVMSSNHESHDHASRPRLDRQRGCPQVARTGPTHRCAQGGHRSAMTGAEVLTGRGSGRQEEDVLCGDPVSRNVLGVPLLSVFLPCDQRASVGLRDDQNSPANAGRCGHLGLLGGTGRPGSLTVKSQCLRLAFPASRSRCGSWCRERPAVG